MCMIGTINLVNKDMIIERLSSYSTTITSPMVSDCQFVPTLQNRCGS